MGECKFCGESAGFLREVHRKCKSRYKKGTDGIVELVHYSATKPVNDYKLLDEAIETLSRTSFVSENEVPLLILRGWELAVGSTIDKADFTWKTKERLRRFGELRYLSYSHMAASPIWIKYSKLRQAENTLETERKRIEYLQEAERNRKVAERIMQETIIDNIKNGRQKRSNLAVNKTPFNLQKSETLLWVFANAEYLKEQVTQRRHQSGRREFPTRYGMKSVDQGTMGVTTKHIYFVGHKERFRIRYDRIVAFKEYPDGIGLTRGAEQQRNQKFVTGEGWFTFNLVTTLARLY